MLIHQKTPSGKDKYIREYYLSLEKRTKGSLNFKEYEQEKQERRYLPVASNLLCGSASTTKPGAIRALSPSLSLPKRGCRLPSLELASGTYRVGQVGPGLEESMGKEEALGFLHPPEGDDILQDHGLGMQPVCHEMQRGFQILSLRAGADFNV